MRKLTAVLFGLMMLASSSSAQSAKEIFTVINKIPTKTEVSAALKAPEPFSDRIKALSEPIEKLENTIENINSSSFGNNTPNMVSDPDGWAKAMEKREKAQKKVSELSDTQMEIMMIHGKYANQLAEYNNSYEEDPIFGEKYSMLQTKYGKRTGNKAEDLAIINKHMKEIHDLNCEISATKMNQRLDIIRKYYEELVSKKSKIIQLDEANEELYMLMENSFGAATNPARSTLIEFAKLYRNVLQQDHPAPLIQYKTYEEAVQDGN